MQLQASKMYNPSHGAMMYYCLELQSSLNKMLKRGIRLVMVMLQSVNPVSKMGMLGLQNLKVVLLESAYVGDIILCRQILSIR